MDDIRIRPLEAADEPALLGLVGDDIWLPLAAFADGVGAWIGGRLVAAVDMARAEGFARPPVWTMAVAASDDGLGLLSLLCTAAIDSLPSTDKLCRVQTSVRTCRQALQWALSRAGMAVVMRSTEAHVGLRDWLVPPIGLPDGLRAESLAVTPITRATMDRLFRLYRDVRMDQPTPTPLARISRAAFERGVLQNPGLLAEASFVALDGVDPVGLSLLYSGPASGMAVFTLTGVQRPHRRQGIATALKWRSLDAAQRLGYQAVVSFAEGANEGIHRANTRLGFHPVEEWVALGCEVDRHGAITPGG